MHERSPKNEPIDTIMYEIEMLRHCAQTLGQKQTSAQQAVGSQYAKAEYYLCIEGFLLHLRNLLAFFTNRCDEATDLGINNPKQWARKEILPKNYADLIKSAKEVNQKFGQGKRTCYAQISKFLQHCTTFRSEEARRWDVEGIFADFDPVLREFEKRFVEGATQEAPSTRQAQPTTKIFRQSNNSTTVFKKYRVL